MDLLEFLLDRFEAGVPRGEYDDAEERLRALLDHALADSLDDERDAFVRALVELRAQAAHDPDYRDHFARSDRFFHGLIAGIVRDGVDEGAFGDVDPDRVAEHLLVAINGAMLERVTAENDGAIRAARAELDEYLRHRLVGDAE